MTSKDITHHNINHLYIKYLYKATSIFAFLFVLLNTSFATSIIVMSTADSGAGSLRAALIYSTTADTIFFDPSVDTITLESQITLSAM